MRTKRPIRPVVKTLSLPEDVVAILDLLLYSEVEGRVPYGAYAEYISRLIREDDARRREALAKKEEKNGE